MTILVIGARGRVGHEVVRGLLDAGQSVRASSRDPQSARFPDGVEAVQADLEVPASLPAALDGVRKVFLYAHPDAVQGFANAARDADVEHVVLLSSATVMHPDAAANPVAMRHLVTEERIDAAALPRTFIRPGYFATNTLRWSSIRTDRVLRTAFPAAVSAPVHERDIADLAVAALLDDAHRGAELMALGAGTVTVREQVAAIADALGEPVRLEVVDEEAFRAEQLTQLPAPLVEILIRSGGNIQRLPGELGTDSVEPVLGRQPLTFARWAQDHAADFR